MDPQPGDRASDANPANAPIPSIIVSSLPEAIERFTLGSHRSAQTAELRLLRGRVKALEQGALKEARQRFERFSRGLANAEHTVRIAELTGSAQAQDVQVQRRELEQAKTDHKAVVDRVKKLRERVAFMRKRHIAPFLQAFDAIAPRLDLAIIGERTQDGRPKFLPYRERCGQYQIDTGGRLYRGDSPDGDLNALMQSMLPKPTSTLAVNITVSDLPEQVKEAMVKGKPLFDAFFLLDEIDHARSRTRGTPALIGTKTYDGHTFAWVLAQWQEHDVACAL